MRSLPALLLGLAAVLPAQEPAAPAAPAAPAKEAKEAVPARPLEPAQVAESFRQFGFAIGGQSPLPGFRQAYDMTPAEVDAFLAGLRLAMLGEAAPAADAALGARFDELLRSRSAGRAERAKKSNADFLAKVDADKEVTKTASGLRYKVVKPGAGAMPTAKSTVSCLYHGTLHDGTVFDSTRSRGNQPVSFGLGEVIPGWTEGLQLIGKGGVIRLWIPANLAYGDQDSGPIPGGSVLEFEVEVVDVK